MNFPDRPSSFDTKRLLTTFIRPVIIGGCRVGFWRRTVNRKAMALELQLFAELDQTQQNHLNRKVARFSKFHGLSATVESTVIAGNEPDLARQVLC